MSVNRLPLLLGGLGLALGAAAASARRRPARMLVGPFRIEDGRLVIPSLQLGVKATSRSDGEKEEAARESDLPSDRVALANFVADRVNEILQRPDATPAGPAVGTKSGAAPGAAAADASNGGTPGQTSVTIYMGRGLDQRTRWFRIDAGRELVIGSNGACIDRPATDVTDGAMQMRVHATAHGPVLAMAPWAPTKPVSWGGAVRQPENRRG